MQGECAKWFGKPVGIVDLEVMVESVRAGTHFES